jgi:hypothetical protein
LDREQRAVRGEEHVDESADDGDSAHDLTEADGLLVTRADLPERQEERAVEDQRLPVEAVERARLGENVPRCIDELGVGLRTERRRGASAREHLQRSGLGVDREPPSAAVRGAPRLERRPEIRASRTGQKRGADELENQVRDSLESGPECEQQECEHERENQHRSGRGNSAAALGG